MRTERLLEICGCFSTNVTPQGLENGTKDESDGSAQSSNHRPSRDHVAIILLLGMCLSVCPL